MAPCLTFMGDGAHWMRLPSLGVYKNPDFILPGPDPEHPQRNITKVVEVFGDFWHSRIFTGKANFDHEQELIAAYADIGIDCLILWESEIKQHPQRVAERIQAFLGISVNP
jgi:G:T-mismatch repair DNA endonuclease (very short patch repair protein)